MKKLIILLLLLPLFSKSQNIEVSGNPIQKDSIIVLDTTLKKDQLYSKGLEWFAETYKSSKAVIELQDKDAGIIIGNARTTCYVKGGALLPPTEVKITYSVKLSFKDGKMKYDIGSFATEGFGVITDGEVIKSTMKTMMNKVYSGTKNHVYSEITSLERSIINAFTKIKNTDW